MLSTSNMNTASATGIKVKRGKQVEDIVRGLAIEEWNARWLEELVAKVKGELTDSAEDDDGSDQSVSNQSVSDEDPATPVSESSSASPKSPSTRHFQPTVEDDVASQDGRNCSASTSPKTTRDNTIIAGVPQPISSRAPSQLSTSSSNLSLSTSTHSASVYNDPTSKINNYLPSPPSSSHGANFPQPRPTVHFSDRRPVIHHTTPANSHRPLEVPRLSIPTRSSAESGISSADVKWGRLFNERDEPTAALGQFLRGIANYIIAEYNPTDSLAIPPEKMHKFYTRYKLDTEILPLQQLFDTTSSKTLRGLEFLYTDLRCQHHLTQTTLTSKPHVPALTPAGFEDWMTLLIRAFPEREAKRLSLVAAELPIIADDRTSSHWKGERFPKHLPRHLFPARSHAKVYDLLVSSLGEWNKITAPLEPPSPVHRLPSGRSSREDTTAKRYTENSHTHHSYSSSYSKPHEHRSKHRERERESRYRGSSARHLSPPRYHHRSKRYRGSSPDESRRRERQRGSGEGSMS